MTQRQSMQKLYPVAKIPSYSIIAKRKTVSSLRWIWILQMSRRTRRGCTQEL
jgi:hypothetical protein